MLISLHFLTSHIVAAILDAVTDLSSTTKNISVKCFPLANDLGSPIALFDWESVSLNGGTIFHDANNILIYHPPIDFVGLDSFTYTVTDGNNRFDTAIVKVAVNVPIDFNQHRTQILNNVNNIINIGVPGNIAVFGSQSFGLFHDGSYNPKIAAGSVGKGKVVVFGHPGYLNFTYDGADTGQLYLNIVRWLADTQSFEVRIISNISETVTWLIGKGFTNVTYYTDWYNHLANVQVAVIGFPNRSIPDSQINSLFEYVANGGGLVIGDGGWIVEAYGGYKLADSPFNKLLYPMGIGLAKGYNRSTDTSNVCSDFANALFAINIVGTQNFSDIEKAEAFQSLNLIVDVIPKYSVVYYDLINAMLIRSENLNPSPTQPVADPIDKFSLIWESDYIRNQPINKIIAHRTAESVYGSIPSDASKVSKSIHYNIVKPSRNTRGDTGADVWLSTGLYAVPGEIITVTVDESLTNLGLKVKINGDWDNLSNRDYYLRMPLGISRDFAIDSSVTYAANAYGGLIYIVLPKDLVPGMFQVTISNAIEAPYFVMGQHNNQDWINSIRNKPAPWAELAAENIIITLSSDKIRNLQDAEKLMAFWENGLFAQDVLAGTVGLRTRPERMYSMIQTAHGGGYAGYPIGAWNWNFAQDTIYEGDCWGEFHELGHLHQSPFWTDNRTTEVTVNIFTMRAIEAVCKSVAAAGGSWPKQWDAYQRILLFQSASNKGGFANGDYVEKLVFYSQLKECFGWQAFQDTFISYRQAAESELPSTDQEEWDQWMCRLSQQVGYDLSPFFISWNYGVSQNAVNSLAYLPKWNMVETISHSITTPINTPVLIPNVTDDDYSFDGILHLEEYGAPLHGSIMIGTDNSKYYVPEINYVGKDFLKYTVSNGFGNTFNGTIEITIPNIETGLVAHWPFENNLYDYTKEQSDGLLDGNAYFIPGKIGTALHFDGIINKVFCGTKPSLSGTTDFTISAWIKTNSHAGGVIIQQRDRDCNGEYYCRVNADGTLFFLYSAIGNISFPLTQ